MGVVLAAELWLTWRTVQDAADAAYDRSLLGAIKAIDANISTASGGLGVELPYRMLEFFELTASGDVYFRVSTEDGLVTIGDVDLPPPPQPLPTGQPRFGNATVFDQPVRVGSYARVLDVPLGAQTQAQRVIIQVAEARRSREQFSDALLRQALQRDLLLVAVALGLLALGVTWALRPLARLRAEVASRPADDLTPIVAGGVPADVRPLVDAINHHVERYRRMMEARRRFIDDASHQLRTPLATLVTQVGFAQRETDPAQLQGALHALKVQLDETIRQTNQMLTLARADSAELETAALDLVAFAGELARAWWPEAEQRGIDLGLDAGVDTLVLPAHAGLLREALANLLHNAIRYTPRGGHVTVRVEATSDAARLAVIDDGPGIPDAERARAGERFFRASNATQPGSGLGLAIARSIAERHGGRLELARRTAGTGLAVTIVLPRPLPASTTRG
ncbi:MAG: sensor histidine kinase N-terminal domain-containing protein [Burkholderiales bacterium]|nr:sensor histidine kinase N-terminal domain-containing protein [Burkholderiales bacterium]